jgi:membrane-bound lytic murein transglycosylase F
LPSLCEQNSLFEGKYLTILAYGKLAVVRLKTCGYNNYYIGKWTQGLISIFRQENNAYGQTIRKWPLVPSLLASILILLAGCQKQTEVTVSNNPISVINVITRNSPTTYYEHRNGPMGFEYELAKLFADHIDAKLNITTAHKMDDIFSSLDNGSADLAAAGLTQTPERDADYQASQSYNDVKQLLLYRYGTYRPRKIDQLVGKDIWVVANSSHAENLRRLQRDLPELAWTESNEVEALDLLERLENNEIEHTIIDSNEYDTHKANFTHIGVALTISKPQNIAWYTAKENPIAKQVDDFFAAIKKDGRLKGLLDNHYGHANTVSNRGSRTFAKKIRDTYPKYESLIKEIASQEATDWALLAAVSYQESHWNPKATSPTGVRGMMMLTRVTAKEMKVENRLDARQSLVGGTRYLNKLKRRLPNDITEPDRTWFALAAYNVGMGHLEDARKITEKQGGDPHLWIDVMQRLPLLLKHAYYSKTRYGYARGEEPVNYVQRIRHYYNILKWNEIAKTRIPPPLQAEKYVPTRMSTQGRLAAL